MFYNKIRCIGKVGKTEKLANNLQIKILRFTKQ